MKLYGYFRSSAAFRVRIARNLKGPVYELVGVHLLCQGGDLGGDQHQPAVLSQPLAIIEYLDAEPERQPDAE